MLNADKIKSWGWRRKKAGLSQEALGELVGKAACEISNYETGKVEPKASLIDKIEVALKK